MPHNTEPAAPPRVEAVVLNWNGGSINLACIAALLDCEYPNLGIIFVDNGSTDGSTEEVMARFPGIQHIQNGENLGFAGGNNRGILRALEGGADMVLILNNDVTVSPGFLQPLVEILARQPALVGPMILDSTGRVWCAGGFVAFHQNVTKLRGFGHPDNHRYGRQEKVDYIPACCLLVSRQVFEAVGYLNEDYFCYLEDVEFCLRARKAGFPVTYCPESRVIHHFSHTTGGGYAPARKYMNAVNSVHFLKEHGTFKSWMAFLLLDVMSLPFLFVMGLLNGRIRGVTAKGRGILTGLAGGKVTAETVARLLSAQEEKR